MTYVVALTGGIGSGKTTAAELFAALGAPVIDADTIARDLTTPHHPALTKIIDYFGDKVIKPNGELDRAWLRTIIFADPSAKKVLEHILHPLIHAQIIKHIKAIKSPYCIVVIPLLAEHYGLYRDIIDCVIVMDTPLDQQRAWAIQRDKSEPQHIDQIIQQQLPQSERLKIADIRLRNDGNIDGLKNHVEALHKRFLALQ
jgi:dephospho-CoA kinase